MYDILELNDKLISELKEIARLMNIQNYDELRRQELIYKILDQQALNPSSTTAIKESLAGKNFGSEKVEVPAPEPRHIEIEREQPLVRRIPTAAEMQADDRRAGSSADD